MLGAIIGDIVGSRFEFQNIYSKEFEFLHPKCRITDDTVLTVAVAKALVECKNDYSDLSEMTVKHLRELSEAYESWIFGDMYRHWLDSEKPEPYGSYGNGSAMRVSACAWAAKSLDEVKKLSKVVTEVTHNHPEGIKGAEATAVAIYLARSGKSISKIRKYINRHYYKLDFTIDGIRGNYIPNETCQQTVPQAIEAFLESTSFEDAIRNAISIGGDSDTIAAITGSIAEAYYGIPSNLLYESLGYVDKFLLEIILTFKNIYC